MFFIKILEKKHENEHCNKKNVVKTPNQRTFSPRIVGFYPIKCGRNTLKNDKIVAGESRGELTSWAQNSGA